MIHLPGLVEILTFEGGKTVTEADRHVRTDVADLAAIIERAAADLALAEEPSGFAVALDDLVGARDGAS